MKKLIHKIILMVFLVVILIEANAQRRRIELSQADTRFTIWAESYYNSVYDENLYYYIQNNTNDKYELVVEVTVTSSCFETKTYKLHVNSKVVLLPGESFTPKSDWAHIYIGSKSKENCRKKVGDTYTYISGISYRYSNIRNITKEELDKQQTKLEAEKIKAKESQENKKNNTASSNQNQENNSKVIKSEQQKEEENVTTKSGTAKAKPETQTEEDKLAQEEINRKAQEEINQKIAAEKIAAAKRKAEEEAEASRLRQENYDNWKTEAQQDRNAQDALALGTSTSMLFFLGGFIYDGMGAVDPGFVYQSPTNKYKPLFFMNNSFGYSGSMEPLLFQSNKTTMEEGEYIDTNGNTNQAGYFVNLGWQSHIGVGNDYYDVYGIIAAKVGIIPTFTGYQYNLGIGGGMDVGVKNIKFYMSYKNNVIEEKSMTSLDVEENGSADYSMPSGEFGYGLKFSFGGDEKSDYKRQHIYLGILNKNFNFKPDSYQSYFDPTTNTLLSIGEPTMKGYSFEWRKDHTFSFFARYYDNHIFVGTGVYDATTSSYPESNNSNTYIEIGFLRTLDYY